MEKSSTFKLVFLAFLLLAISASTLARRQPTSVVQEVAREEQLLKKLDAYKKIIAAAATRKLELIQMVGGAQAKAQQCGKRGAYCNTDKDCCSGSCREDDDQDYYTGYTTCI